MSINDKIVTMRKNLELLEAKIEYDGNIIKSKEDELDKSKNISKEYDRGQFFRGIPQSIANKWWLEAEQRKIDPLEYAQNIIQEAVQKELTDAQKKGKESMESARKSVAKEMKAINEYVSELNIEKAIYQNKLDNFKIPEKAKIAREKPISPEEISQIKEALSNLKSVSSQIKLLKHYQDKLNIISGSENVQLFLAEIIKKQEACQRVNKLLDEDKADLRKLKMILITFKNLNYLSKKLFIAIANSLRIVR